LGQRFLGGRQAEGRIRELPRGLGAQLYRLFVRDLGVLHALAQVAGQSGARGVQPGNGEEATGDAAGQASQ
jgi:hypothetical protein